MEAACDQKSNGWQFVILDLASAVPLSAVIRQAYGKGMPHIL
jgi:hypothetical protein